MLQAWQGVAAIMEQSGPVCHHELIEEAKK